MGQTVGRALNRLASELAAGGVRKLNCTCALAFVHASSLPILYPHPSDFLCRNPTSPKLPSNRTYPLDIDALLSILLFVAPQTPRSPPSWGSLESGIRDRSERAALALAHP